MKADRYSPTRLIRGSLILSLFIFISCGTVYFDHPQPVNSKNLKSVPKEIQGTWKTRHKIADKSSIYEEVITIDKNSFRKYSTEYYSIAKSEIDTSLIYKLSEGNIIITWKDKSRSYPYRLLNDSIRYSNLDDELEYVLSDSVLLRSPKDCYVVSLKNRTWWEIVFIKKMPGGEILIIYPLAEDLLKMKSGSDLMVLDSANKDSIYFHADFKSKNIKNVINKEEPGVIYTLFPDSTFKTTK